MTIGTEKMGKKIKVGKKYKIRTNKICHTLPKVQIESDYQRRNLLQYVEEL